jgi:hypothetical protein
MFTVTSREVFITPFRPIFSSWYKWWFLVVGQKTYRSIGPAARVRTIPACGSPCIFVVGAIIPGDKLFVYSNAGSKAGRGKEKRDALDGKHSGLLKSNWRLGQWWCRNVNKKFT